jgi:hypothetical protein
MVWVEHAHIKSDATFDFRSSLGHVYTIFALQTVIAKNLSSKNGSTAVISILNVRLIQKIEPRCGTKFLC